MLKTDREIVEYWYWNNNLNIVKLMSDQFGNIDLASIEEKTTQIELGRLFDLMNQDDSSAAEQKRLQQIGGDNAAFIIELNGLMKGHEFDKYEKCRDYILKRKQYFDRIQSDPTKFTRVFAEAFLACSVDILKMIFSMRFTPSETKMQKDLYGLIPFFCMEIVNNAGRKSSYIVSNWKRIVDGNTFVERDIDLASVDQCNVVCVNINTRDKENYDNQYFFMVALLKYAHSLKKDLTSLFDRVTHTTFGVRTYLFKNEDTQTKYYASLPAYQRPIGAPAKLNDDKQCLYEVFIKIISTKAKAATATATNIDRKQLLAIFLLIHPDKLNIDEFNGCQLGDKKTLTTVAKQIFQKIPQNKTYTITYDNFLKIIHDIINELDIPVANMAVPIVPIVQAPKYQIVEVDDIIKSVFNDAPLESVQNQSGRPKLTPVSVQVPGQFGIQGKQLPLRIFKKHIVKKLDILKANKPDMSDIVDSIKSRLLDSCTKDDFTKIVNDVVKKGGSKTVTINGITRVVYTIDRKKCVKYKKQWLSIKEFTRLTKHK
jgi:hypothetical protein